MSPCSQPSGSVTKSTDAISRTVDGVEVVVVVPSLQTFVLNEVGSEIWRLADGRTVEAIAREIEARFDTSEEQALLDVAEFVAELVRGNALRVTPRGK